MSRPGRIVLAASLLGASYGVGWLHGCTSGIPDPASFEKLAHADFDNDLLSRGFPTPNRLECQADPMVSWGGGIWAEIDCQTEHPESGPLKARYIYDYDGTLRFADFFDELSGER